MASINDAGMFVSNLRPCGTIRRNIEVYLSCILRVNVEHWYRAFDLID